MHTLRKEAIPRQKRMNRQEREQIAEIGRILSTKPQQFRLQFWDGADAVREETDIWAPDAPTAMRMADDALLHAEASGMRVKGPDGSIVYERQKADFYSV